jgi:hypothetical protein
MVERVLKVFPHVQVTVMSLYSGCMPAFMVGTSDDLYEAESTVLKGHAATPIARLKTGPRTLAQSFRLNKR